MLGFHRSDGLQVQALQTGTQDNLREMLEKVINRIDALESRLEEKHVTSSPQKFRQDTRRCYHCNKEGHIKRNCPSAARGRESGYAQWDEKKVSPFLVLGTNCTTMRARGLIGKRPVNFLIDTGAAISVICHTILPGSVKITQDAPFTIGANGSPLDVVGSVELKVSLDRVYTNHVFVVVRQLTVECLLGMDFLSCHRALIDCCNSKLMLRSSGEQSHMEVSRQTVPCGKVTENSDIELAVNMAETMKLPARSQIIVKGRINNCSGLKGEEGLIEPTSVKKGLLIARSLSKVDANNEVPMNITNIGHELRKSCCTKALKWEFFVCM